MKVLVSACLLGQRCKYNGGSNLNEQVIRWLQGHEVIPVCPEVLGGLPVPRTPSEIVLETVMDRNGRNVDREFRTGAEAALRLARESQVELAILQPRSPSCGLRQIYDGTFSGKLVPGRGIFAALLMQEGIPAAEPADLHPDGSVSLANNADI